MLAEELSLTEVVGREELERAAYFEETDDLEIAEEGDAEGPNIDRLGDRRRVIHGVRDAKLWRKERRCANSLCEFLCFVIKVPGLILTQLFRDMTHQSLRS